MRQTWALFVDAYREINSKKMFWVVLILSAIVVVVFAGAGINQRGLTIFGFEFQSPFNTTLISRVFFYKFLFSHFGIGLWITWWGMALALISTAGIIPDLISSGSVDLFLSRPISRVRLFLTKYFCGLLFVALQIAIFATACFLVIGIRGDAWLPAVFLSIPIVVLVFSFIYCVCALLGMLTRLVVASLLLTMLFWLFVFGIDTGEKQSLAAVIAGQMETAAYAAQFGYKDQDLTRERKNLSEGDTRAQARIDGLQRDRAALLQKQRDSDPSRRSWETFHRILYRVKSFVPKTSETNSLLDRWLKVTDDTQKKGEKPSGGWFSALKDRTEVSTEDQDVQRELVETLGERPVLWVMGTSVAFEAVVLALACWIFCRRDF